MFSKIKKFKILTFVGLFLIISFTILCFIDNLVIRWWLMVPIAGVSSFILYRQSKKTFGFEKQISFYGFIIIIGVFIFRDIMLAHNIASVINTFGEKAMTIHKLFK